MEFAFLELKTAFRLLNEVVLLFERMNRQVPLLLVLLSVALLNADQSNSLGAGNGEPPDQRSLSQSELFLLVSFFGAHQVALHRRLNIRSFKRVRIFNRCSRDFLLVSRNSDQAAGRVCGARDSHRAPTRKIRRENFENARRRRAVGRFQRARQVHCS